MVTWMRRDLVGCLEVGDVVLIPSIIPGTGITIYPINHIGVIVYVCNVPYIVHVPFNCTPILESVEQFEKSRPIVRVLRNEQTRQFTNDQLVNNYYRLAKKKYNFFKYNCEDFIRELTEYKIDVGLDQRCGYSCMITILLIIILLIIIFR